MSGLAFLGVVAAYLLIGVFVYFVANGDDDCVDDGKILLFVAFWPIAVLCFAFVGVVFAVAWLGCKLHDLIF